MIIRLFLALLLLVAVMACISWYSNADRQQRNNLLRNLLMWGIGIGVLLLVITGRIPALFALVSAALPFYRRIMLFKGLWQFFGRSLSPSKLTTPWLCVQYDFTRKTLDAQVLQGEFQGQNLSQLDQAQLATLLAACQQDLQSKTAIHAFMAIRDRQAGDRQAGGGQTGGGQAGGGQTGGGGGWGSNPHEEAASGANSGLSKQQAYEVLGLKSGADAAAIKKAHQRLMQKLHPDRGGSNYLAAQINTAKDTLLNT